MDGCKQSLCILGRGELARRVSAGDDGQHVAASAALLWWLVVLTGGTREESTGNGGLQLRAFSDVSIA